MTKEELLANLKPLCWSELEDDDNHLFICNTLFGDYVIYNYYSLKFNGNNIGCFDYEEAKEQDLQRIVENIKLSECMTVAIEFDNQILKSVNLNKNQFLKGKYNAK